MSIERTPGGDCLPAGQSADRVAMSFYLKLLAAAFVLLLFTHVLWRFTLPVPWIDEPWFFIPAINFAKHGSFAADRMLVHQIYWMPIASYVFNGIGVLTGQKTSLEFARFLSFIFVTAATVLLRHSLAFLLPSVCGWPLVADALAIAWYVSLPVVFEANLLRPDALCALLSLGTLGLVLHRRFIGALGLAVICALTHPLQAFPACVLALCFLPVSWRARSQSPKWEWLVLVLSMMLLTVEASRLIGDFAEYCSQFQMQITRKASRQVSYLSYVLTAGMIPIAATLLYRSLLGTSEKLLSPNNRSGFVGLYALASIFVWSYGQEMWYFPSLLLGMLLLTVLPTKLVLSNKFNILSGVRTRLSAINKPLLTLVILSLGLATWLPGLRAKGVYGFSTRYPVLAGVEYDREVLDRQILTVLRAENAKVVLISPQLYGPFMKDVSEKAAPQLFTWNPFSKPSELQFDHLVFVSRSYPSGGKDSIPSFLSRYECGAQARIDTPRGNYAATIVSLSLKETSPSSLKSCSELDTTR